MSNGKPIKSFADLEIYKNSYAASLQIHTKVIPKIPKEDYDLIDQLRRSSKAIPRLIAEGYSKKHQKKGFQRYLDEALAESNETIVSLSHVRDLYYYTVNIMLLQDLIDTYVITSKQIYTLSKKWDEFLQR